MDLSAAQQQQGAAYLFQTSGFTPWTCNGCNSALANYVASQGGPSAFTLSYANAGLDGAPPGTDGEGAALPVPSTTSAPSTTATTGGGTVFTPFSDVYNTVATSVLTDINNVSTQTVQMASGPLVALLGLMVVILGIRTMYAYADFKTFALKMGNMLIVITFATGGTWYQQVFVQFVEQGLPAWIAQQIGNSTFTSPAAAFDQAILKFMELSWTAWKTSSYASMWYLGLIMLAALIIVAIALIVMFVAYVTLAAILSLIVVLIPLLILGLLFSHFEKYFWGGIDAIVAATLAMLVVDLLVVILVGSLNTKLGTIVATSSATVIATDLFYVALEIVILALIVPVALKVVEGITGHPVHIRIPSATGVAMSVVGGLKKMI